MQRIALFCSLIFLAASAFAQNCETFSKQLDDIKSGIQQAPEKELADVDFIYTLDKRIITEADLRATCQEGITVEKIMYRRVEGHSGTQPLVRLVTTAIAPATTPEPAYLLKWTFADGVSVPKGIYQHPYFHQEMEEDGQRVFIFWLKSPVTKELLNEINPAAIEAITVWKDELQLKKYDVAQSEGIIEIVLKETNDYLTFLELGE